MHRILILSACAMASVVSAQTTVQIGPAKDNTLYEDAGGVISNGAGQHLFAGLTAQPTKRRALLAFDVAAAVPAGSLILSASLQLNVSRTIDTLPLQVDMHRVLADWGEGPSDAFGQEGNGALAAPGDATWIHRFSPSSNWTAAGGDFAAVVSASAMVPPAIGLVSWPSTKDLVADVKLFLDQPAQNFGWLLKSDEAQPFAVRRFDSREHPTSANQPVLTITYLPPGATQSVGGGCIGSNALPFTLSHTGTPVPGGGFALVHGNGLPGQLSGNVISLGPGGGPTPIYPGCDILLDLLMPVVTHNVLFLDGAGAGTTPLPIPAGIPGLPVVFQAFALDPPLPAGFVLSNALRAVTG